MKGKTFGILLSYLCFARCSPIANVDLNDTSNSECPTTTPSNSDDFQLTTSEENEVSFEEIAVLVKKHCLQCHSTNGQSPNLSTYSNFTANQFQTAEQVVVAVQSRTMPKGAQLSNSEIQLFEKWKSSQYQEFPTNDSTSTVQTKDSECAEVKDVRVGAKTTTTNTPELKPSYTFNFSFATKLNQPGFVKGDSVTAGWSDCSGTHVSGVLINLRSSATPPVKLDNSTSDHFVLGNLNGGGPYKLYLYCHLSAGSKYEMRHTFSVN